MLSDVRGQLNLFHRVLGIFVVEFLFAPICVEKGLGWPRIAPFLPQKGAHVPTPSPLAQTLGRTTGCYEPGGKFNEHALEGQLGGPTTNPAMGRFP